MAPKTTPNHRIEAGRVPVEARGVQKPKKQAKTTPQVGQKDAKEEPWPHRVAKRVPKRNFTKNDYFWDSCAQGLISTRFLSNLEAIYPRHATKIQQKRSFFKAGSKMQKYVSTAPARADGGSNPPEKRTKAKKNDLRTSTPTRPIFQ